MTGSGPESELIVGRYRVICRLGGGAMGDVFEVVHPTLPRHEAVKLLSSALSADPNFKTRFLREADVMASLVHPNIVTVFDRGEDPDGRMWLAMELVDGVDAAQLLDDHGPVPADLAIEVIAGAGAALDFAWRTKSVTHRDVKPANILVKLDNAGRAERVKLADFGIAKASDGPTNLTATGMTVGTPAYMAPEALEGHELDGMADQYSLGCTAFALLTGTSPFEASTAAAIMAGHLNRPVPAVTSLRPDLSPALDNVFRRVLSKQPEKRYATCGEFVDDFRDAVDQASSAADPTQLAAAWTALRPSASVGLPSTPPRRASVTPAGFDRLVAPNRARMIVGVAAAVLLLAGALAYVAWPSNNSATEAAAPSTSTTAAPALAETPAAPSAETPQSAAKRIKAAVSEVRELIGITEDNDPNDLIGRPRGYLAATVVVDSRGECSPPEDIGANCGATIEQWADHEAAQQRADYIQEMRREVRFLDNEWNTVHGALLLRVSGKLKPSEAEQYENAFLG